MTRVDDPSAPMAWSAHLPISGASTGFDPGGWPTSTWVLHAMYEHADLMAPTTHDDLHRARLATGDATPQLVGEVDLDALTEVSGIPLGVVGRPGEEWTRVTWAEYLGRLPDRDLRRDAPPSFRWFPAGNWPAAVAPPPEGSLDDLSLEALLAVLASRSPQGEDTPCFAFYASLPAGDFDSVHLWTGPLGSVRDLLEEHGGAYGYSPTNLWPADRAWFVSTDYDLQATKVSGDHALVAALRAEPRLECLEWSGPAES